MFSEIHKEFDIAEPNCARCSRKAKDFVRPNTQKALISWSSGSIGKKKKNLLSELFVTKEKFTSEEVMKVLKFENSVSEKNKEFFNRFLQKCSECKLQQFLLFVTAIVFFFKKATASFKNNRQRALFKRHFWSHLCIHYSIAIDQYSKNFEVALLSSLNSSTSRKSFSCV